MKKAVMKACQVVCTGFLVLAIGVTALPHASAAESTEMQESAEALAESITQAVIETFTDEALSAPYEYAPYGDLTVITGYTAEELEHAAHVEELPQPRYTVVTILAAMRGVGGDDSWGAPVYPEYCVSGEHDITFSFVIGRD